MEVSTYPAIWTPLAGRSFRADWAVAAACA